MRHSHLGLLVLCLCSAVLYICTTPPSVTSALSIDQPTTRGRTFDRIIQVWFSNTHYNETIENLFFRMLVNGRGQLLNRSYGVTHPSQPNYIAGTAGDYFNKNTNEDLELDVSNIVDLLEKGGISWKSYHENYPRYTGQADSDREGWINGCYVKSKSDDGLYVRKHNPFMSYNNVRASRSRCSRIVPGDQLAKDIANNDIPQYMFYSPNIENNGYDTNIEYAGEYLMRFVRPLLDNRQFKNGTLVVVTFAQDGDSDSGNNKVYTALFGPMVKPGTIDRNNYTHYSLLRTVEENWQLGTLGRNDDKAIPYQFPTDWK